jgi:hypothetical protein
MFAPQSTVALMPGGTPADDAAVQIVAFNAAEPGWRATLSAFVSTPGGSGIMLAPMYGAPSAINPISPPW